MIDSPFVHAKFHFGDQVEKVSGSSWSGRVVGWYSTKLTPEGYAVESDLHPGSVQIYPAKALRSAVSPQEREGSTVTASQEREDLSEQDPSEQSVFTQEREGPAPNAHQR